MKRTMKTLAKWLALPAAAYAVFIGVQLFPRMAHGQSFPTAYGPVCLNPLNTSPCSDSIWDLGGAPVVRGGTTSTTGFIAPVTYYSPLAVPAAPASRVAFEYGTCVLGTSCATMTTHFSSTTGETCWCVDTTAANACKAAVVSATSMTATGNSTDSISWYCLGPE